MRRFLSLKIICLRYLRLRPYYLISGRIEIEIAQ